ncbi:cell division protein SepF [Actinomycetospora chibensis]|nr:cell division protein SepF [Actinomycetospora chibensis]MDD7925436.1 cell division protein SepF [Actinomycetospora chibensis]
MTTLHRVKAYFGMVPADELDSYDGYDDDRYDSERDRRPVDRHTGDRHPVDRHRYAADRFDDRFDDRDGGYDRYGRGRREDRDEQERYDRYDRYEERRTPRPRDPEVTEIRREEEPATETVSRAGRGRSWAHNTGPSHTSVRPTTHRTPPSLSSASAGGSSGPASSSASDTAATPAVKGPTAVPSVAPDPDPASGPAEITSLQPKSYNEARLIGERYRDGIPVIMNLTEMDDAGAKRLVDFAAGLAFALRGSIEKVTNRVFLLSPPNVEVSASDRRKLAEKNYASTS